MATFVLAAGVGEVLPVLFVLVAIATGIINYFREKSAAEEAKRNRRRPTQRPQRQRESDDDITFLGEDAFIDEGERRRRKRPQQRRPQRKRPRRDREQEDSRQSQRRSVADRHMESAVSQRHVQSSVSDRHVESRVENRHLEPNVEAAAPRSARGNVPVRSPIADMLKSADGVRTAIILNEILSPPPGRRGKS